VDNTTGPLCACVLNEALDASLHLYLVSKVKTPSVIKQPDSKCFREAPIVSFHLICCSFVMTALIHFECMASSCGNSALHCPSSRTASWHGLYKPLDLHKGERRVKLQFYLLFYNTLYSNIRARMLGVTFYDGISCKCSMICSSSTKWDRPELSMPICFAVTNLLFNLKSIFHFSWPLITNFSL